MIVVCHEEDYFEKTPIEKQRVCCNCRNRKTSETVSKCMIDGHYIGYVQCFTNWCLHWATDELKWIVGDTDETVHKPDYSYEADMVRRLAEAKEGVIYYEGKAYKGGNE